MEYFYLSYAVIGGVKGFNGVRSVIVRSVDLRNAQQFVRDRFQETGRKVLIMQGIVATVDQIKSNRIPIYQ